MGHVPPETPPESIDPTGAPANLAAPAPDPARPRRPLRPWEWRLLGILFLCFLARDVPWRLDEYDQAKQAYTSLEMVEEGHWWYQHTPGGKSATKPPLVAWVSALIYETAGENWDIAWRLPSLLAAVALLIILWNAGEDEWPGWGGTIAAAAFGFNLLAPRLASLVRTDMPLTLGVTAVGLIVWKHVREGGRPWSTPSRTAVFIILTLACMTKGPIAYAFLVPGMLAHHLICRRRGKPSPTWGGWWHWALPLVPFVTWTMYGIENVPGFYTQVVSREFLGRFTMGKTAVHHNQAIPFYFLQLCKDWAPWSILLFAASLRARRVWGAMWKESGTLWLICWLVGGLILMSFVPSKRIHRIFPVVPPLTLVLVATLARAQRQAEWDHAQARAPQTSAPAGPEAAGSMPIPLDARTFWPWKWSRAIAAVAVLLGVCAAVNSVFQVYHGHRDKASSFAREVLSKTAGRRLEFVAGPSVNEWDETMLVYLRRLSFISPAEAVQLWSTGRLDAVVLDNETLEKTSGLLEPFAPRQPVLTSVPSKATDGQATPVFVLLTSHEKPAEPPNRAPPTRHGQIH